MIKIETETLYVNKKSAVYLSKNNDFIYEVCVFCRYKNYYSLIDNVHYAANKELESIVPSFVMNASTKITCELLAAPLGWLLDNGYLKYQKPDKKKSTKKSNKNDK